MKLSTAIEFIQPAFVPSPSKPEYWADLGCGAGRFTHALQHLLPIHSNIYACDLDINLFDWSSVEADRKDEITLVQKDFTTWKPSTLLHGILLANSLHFVDQKASFLTGLVSGLKINGRLLIIEYDSDRANSWVPYPISFTRLHHLGSQLELQIKKIATLPSRYHGSMYLASLTK